MNQFINIIAWTFAVLSSILLIARICFGLWWFSEGNKLNRMLHEMKHTGRSYPVKVPALVSFLCWLWIYTNPLS